MKVSSLRISIFLLMAIISVLIHPLSATDEQWVRINDEYQTYFEPLPGYTKWTFNATRGPNDRWGINFTISGFVFHPTTFLICDELQYLQWLQTGSSSGCHLDQSVNYSLHTTVDLSHQSQWYCVLNNTGPVTLYFSLHIIHYQRLEPTTPTPTNPYSGIINLLGYIIILSIIIFVIIPCICRVSCCGYYRRRPKTESKNKESNAQPIIVVLTPENHPYYTDDEENQ
ncbi:MAG: hypothetical protein ACFFBR_09510 [Promethearchaeota archaeon]